MKVVDHPTETRALSLSPNEVITESLLRKALMESSNCSMAEAENMAGTVFDAIESSCIVYRPVLPFAQRAVIAS